jgi:hypothetical protein
MVPVPPHARLASRVVIALAAIWIGVVGLIYGTWSAGTADSHGYISQAALWLDGDLIVRHPLAASVPWPHAEWSFSPLGYRPGQARGLLVPTYPVGRPIVMAGFQAIGGPRAVYLVVPLFGVLAIFATARLATQFESPLAGAAAALCLASSPTFLYSLMWPMSDVPAAALWSLAIVGAAGGGIPSAIGAGVAAGLAVLTRPNLVLVAVAPACYLLWRVRHRNEMRTHLDQAVSAAPHARRLAWIRLAIVCGLIVSACAGVAAVHTWLYGSPLSTGYGPVGQIYALSHVTAAATGFALRPLSLEPALVVLCVVGMCWQIGSAREPRTLVWAAMATIALVLVSYAFYVSFAEWWYLRLLLPAWPIAAAFAGVAMVRLVQRVPARWQAIAALGLIVVIVGTGGRETVRRGVFTLRASESRYETVARFVRRALPANAVFFSFQESGSLRFYADRLIVRFDILPEHRLNQAIDTLRARGYRPYFVIEQQEEDVFKARYDRLSPLSRLDWTPVAELDGPVRVRIFDPADHDKPRDGQPITTFPIRP